MNTNTTILQSDLRPTLLRLKCMAGLLLMFAHLAHAQVPASAVEREDATRQIAALQQPLARARAEWEKRVANLRARYLAQLAPLLQERKAAADNAAVLAIQAEQFRVMNNRPINAQQLQAMRPALRALCTTYNEDMTKILAEADEGRTALERKLYGDLEALETTLKASGLATEANLVGAERVRFREKIAARRLSRNIPLSMSGRLTSETRNALLVKGGGKPKLEKAVMMTLKWLKENQNADGSWSDEYKPAMTGLALLCFLGHGELGDSAEFGETVKKTLDWILERGNEFKGRLSLTKDGFAPNSAVYEHAILTYALCEYFAMTRDTRFEPLVRTAVEYIVNGQTELGGWDYRYEKGPRNDLSVAGWQIQALKTAHLTGLQIAGVEAALDKSMEFIKKWQGNEGGFGYDRPENRLSLTGVGVYCAYSWRGTKDRTVKEGIDYLLGKSEVKYKGGRAGADLYGCYYDTLACYHFGGSAWQKWNRMFQDEIADNQSPDGSWAPTQGSVGDLQQKPNGAGPYFRTTLCCLMLEVFYRYTPIR